MERWLAEYCAARMAQTVNCGRSYTRHFRDLIAENECFQRDVNCFAGPIDTPCHGECGPGGSKWHSIANVCDDGHEVHLVIVPPVIVACTKCSSQRHEHVNGRSAIVTESRFGYADDCVFVIAKRDLLANDNRIGRKAPFSERITQYGDGIPRRHFVVVWYC